MKGRFYCYYWHELLEDNFCKDCMINCTHSGAHKLDFMYKGGIVH